MKAVIVGVYPSAFHVAWSPPARLDPRPIGQQKRAFISSLAVDVEPVVFWDGKDPSPGDLLETWKLAAGFEGGRHGSVSLGNNGPSGAGLLTNSLEPLRLLPEEVAFTDAVPWFFVKHGPNSQGAAITERFQPIASQLGLDGGLLPERPTARRLVELARDGRPTPLADEIVGAGAPLVITLGQEALDAVRSVADRCDGVQQKLAIDGYGRRGTVTLGAATMQLLPLVHPGFQRQTTSSRWRETLARWRVGEV